MRLHERELRAFLPAWTVANERGLALPATTDPDYASLETLLRHVLRAAGGYLTWMCSQLGLPDPGIAPLPEGPLSADRAAAHIDHLVERWRTPLAPVEEERFFRPAYTTRWGAEMPIEAMLEHAVMHPVRHRFQLENLLRAATPPHPGWHGALADALARVPAADGARFAGLFGHGTLAVEIYAPRGHDPQQPHSRDEAYVVARGHGEFRMGGRRVTFGPGDLLFVPAGMEHRFENFSDDLAVWVLFHGPAGGERA